MPVPTPDPTPEQRQAGAALFDLIRERAVEMAKVAFMEWQQPWPTTENELRFIRTFLGIGIAAASEHYASNPQHLALAANPNCVYCGAAIQTLQVGVDPVAPGSPPARVAWPCGHRQ